MSQAYFNPEIHHRHAIRLKGYDYSMGGSYFITLCTHKKACLLGRIENGQMHINPIAKMIQIIWNEIPEFYKNFDTDTFQLMPNHLHGILKIVGYPFNTQSPGQAQGPAPTVGDIVARFKSLTSKRFRDMMNSRHTQSFDGKLWQRNYYEHIIRSETEYYQIRDYIIKNPFNWDRDELRI